MDKLDKYDKLVKLVKLVTLSSSLPLSTFFLSHFLPPILSHFFHFVLNYMNYDLDSSHPHLSEILTKKKKTKKKQINASPRGRAGPSGFQSGPRDLQSTSKPPFIGAIGCARPIVANSVRSTLQRISWLAAHGLGNSLPIGFSSQRSSTILWVRVRDCHIWSAPVALLSSFHQWHFAWETRPAHRASRPGRFPPPPFCSCRDRMGESNGPRTPPLAPLRRTVNQQ